jgi:rRNA maturation RNase YbeY
VINFIDQQSEFPIKQREKIRNWIKQIILSFDKKCSNLNLVFVEEDDILKTNIDFLQHNYLTDIITFDYCEGSTISGELIICPSVVNSNSKDFNTTFENELHRVIIHGVLHLLGYKDSTTEEQSEMRSQENKALLLFDQQMK